MIYKHYKTNGGKNKGKSDNVIKIAAIIFCIAITFMFASLIYGNIFINAQKGGDFFSIPAREYYCISFGSYSAFSEAQKAASALRARGGGGYIHKDNDYQVLAALYINSADANSVCQRLKNAGCDCSVYVIKIPNCNFYYDSKQISYQTVNGALNIFNIAVESLYSVFIDIDGKMITDSDARLRLSALKKEISRKREEFEAASVNLKERRYSILKAELASLEINVGIISEASFITENTAVEIKYYMLKIAFSYQKFIYDISKL